MNFFWGVFIMKKIVSILLFLLFTSVTFAQKSYIHITDSYSVMSLSGDIPEGINKNYYNDYIPIGDLLNKLAQQGFELEFAFSNSHNNYYILSKNNSSNSSTPVKTIKSDDDSEIYEVARYNLQGLPVSEHAKGIQIVVYSNYTTKTIIRE